VLILRENQLKFLTFLKEQDFNIIKNAAMLSFKNIGLYSIKRNCKLCGFVVTLHNQIKALFVEPT
jgi:hypothetical protein